MTLKFDLDAGDIAAFHRHYFRNSAQMKRKVSMARWVFPFIFIVFGLNFLSRGVTVPSLAIAGGLLVLAILWVILIRGSMEKNFLRRAERVARETGVTGPCEMEVTEARLQCTMKGITSGFTWDNIVSVYESPGYIFIYRTDMEAFILPKSKIGKGELEDFRKMVKSRRR